MSRVEEEAKTIRPSGETRHNACAPLSSNAESARSAFEILESTILRGHCRIARLGNRLFAGRLFAGRLFAVRLFADSPRRRPWGRIAGGRAPHGTPESSRKTWRRENHRYRSDLENPPR